MSTTTLFVELLIIGFQACVWLFLVASSTIGVNSINFITAKFDRYPALTTALVFALAYVLGIFFDKLAKWLIEESRLGRSLQSLKDRMANPNKNALRDLYQEKYAYIMVRKGQPMSDLLYARSKVRILRASIINIPLVTLAAMLCMHTYLKIPSKLIYASLAVTFVDGFVLTLLFAWLYAYNEVLHQKRLQLFYKETKVENKKG
jgi:hypothetical protein